MSTSHLPKHAEFGSGTSATDANDSGFSEICHVSGAENCSSSGVDVCHGGVEDGHTWSSTRLATDDTGHANATFMAPPVQRSSTPNKYTIYQCTAPRGRPQCAVVPGMSRLWPGNEDVRSNVSYMSAQSVSRGPVSVHVQAESNATVADDSKLHDLLRQTLCTPKEMAPFSSSTPFDPAVNESSSTWDLRKLIITDLRNNINLDNRSQYSPNRKPVKIEIDDDAANTTSQAVSVGGANTGRHAVSVGGSNTGRHAVSVGVVNTGRHAVSVGAEEALNLIKTETSNTFSDQAVTNQPSVRELLIKRNTETVPVLDLRRQTMSTLDQLLKMPPTFRTMTLPLHPPQTVSEKPYTSTVAPSNTSALAPARVYKSSAQQFALSTGQDSYNLMTSVGAMSPAYSRTGHVFQRASLEATNVSKQPNVPAAAVAHGHPRALPVAIPFSQSRTLPTTPSFTTNSSVTQPPNVWPRCLTAGEHPFHTAERSHAVSKESTKPAVPSYMPSFADRSLNDSLKSHSHSTPVDLGALYSHHLPESSASPEPYSDFSDEELPESKPDVNNNRAVFQLPYSDISGEESPTDTFATSESSGDETSRAAQIYAVRKSRKLRRKSLVPRRSPDKRDPRFKGVTIWLQTEFKNGDSHLHLSAFYSNVKVGVAKPRYALTRTCGISSCSEAEGYSPPTPARDTYASVKTCASCRTRRTPLWRDAEDGTPLCNACGIRYKKYRLRCSRCWFIPKKDIKTYPNCPACGSALRYSFHRKAW